MGILLSVIVPVYNAQDHLQKSIESILNQTLREIEIIIIDDGSTDNSWKIINEYAKKDFRIKAIHQENSGVSSARNIGIKLAKGKYIGFVDPDDWIENNMYEELYTKCITNNCEIGMCDFMIEKYENKFIINNTLDLNDGEIIHGNYVRDKIGAKILLGEIFTSVWDKIYLNEFLKKNNIEFIEKVTFREDYFFNIEIINFCNSIIYISKPLYHYVENLNGATNQYHKDNFLFSKELFNKKLFYANQWLNVKNEYLIKISHDFILDVLNSATNTYYNKCSFINKLKIIKNMINDKETRKGISMLDNIHKKFYYKDNIKIFFIRHKLILMIYLISILKNKIKLK